MKLAIVIKLYQMSKYKCFRLLTEKINKNERKNNAEIIVEDFGEESKEFRSLLQMDDLFDSTTDIQVSRINS